MSSKPINTKRAANVKRLPVGITLGLLSGLGIAAAQPAQAQYTYTAFNVGISGASSTSIYGINDSSQIVGSYATISRGGLTTFHGFYGTTAAQTAVNGPAGLVSTTNPFAEINKINNAGTYVGDYQTTVNAPQGFTGAAGTVAPTTTTNSTALGINNAGTTVGQVFNISGSASQSYVQANGGALTAFDVTGYGTSEATGINDIGTIVGTAAVDSITSPTVSYIRSAGATPTFSFLNISGALDIYAQGINNSGVVVGAYDTTAGGALTGFVAFNGTVTNIVFPTAASTQVNGINNLGQIVGSYTDSSGALHGFLAAPAAVPEASTTVSLGLLLALGLGGVVFAAKRKKSQSAA